ncbi:hypothetical protein A2866_03880 [Candidatus Roizmanbacteria bacterium RIFCSPHIGHO2_01_FULL_39_8]|uniref:SIS domain-containing protein n=2 Tax=Candidatus Roizmaniibacteriota TaxID=1752723 RepID=A0A1F7GRQ8_9BACT|nr:MAG: hypothetical protein A2866_03880 [Candidatus Roizmanbacteria bacterium RIFCSPHIGHO2_01_FULL_39_8]OGK26880.1 MAG: hypothetical protein A3C28_03265 [Candidatus Roizmanbacteria bacterium RIFCSPHIGHO2_02_FULL_39_9]
MKLFTLDQIVIQALDFFIKDAPPSVDVQQFNSPFVVGSGNAYNTGVVLFSGKNTTLADESTFRTVLQQTPKKTKDGSLKDVVVISASGSKDSVWEIELAKKLGFKTTLLTTKAHSDGAKIADKVIVFQSIPEPYTYNVSTYMGMILGATNENPSKIKAFIQKLAFPSGFSKHTGFAFVVPDRFAPLCQFIDIKKSELFGPHVSLRAFSQGHARHAKFVIRTPQELVISLGQKNEFFGDPKHRWDIYLPDDFDFAAMMATTYYIIGKIQESKPPYYMDNITRYVNKDGPKAYGPNKKPFEIIVPGSLN